MCGNLKIKKGSIVRATAGRDFARFFVILDIDGKFVKIADGKSRPLSNPKTKSLKHLQITNTVIDIDDLTDKRLKKVLAAFNAENAQEEDLNV